MSTDIYDAFGYDYEKELQQNSDNFVPMGSKNPKTNIRTSPIVVPAAVKSVARVSVKRAERPTTTTARKAIIQKMPTNVRQEPYDYDLNRPVSPIQVNPMTSKSEYDDWTSIYDDDFRGGKKGTRKARSARRKRTRSVRRTRTKKSYSRRYRGRKTR